MSSHITRLRSVMKASFIIKEFGMAAVHKLCRHIRGIFVPVYDSGGYPCVSQCMSSGKSYHLSQELGHSPQIQVSAPVQGLNKAQSTTTAALSARCYISWSHCIASTFCILNKDEKLRNNSNSTSNTNKGVANALQRYKKKSWAERYQRLGFRFLSLATERKNKCYVKIHKWKIKQK